MLRGRRDDGERDMRDATWQTRAIDNSVTSATQTSKVAVGVEISHLI
jgi:hypothetical protein